jgi:hypothetical protein
LSAKSLSIGEAQAGEAMTKLPKMRYGLRPWKDWVLVHNHVAHTVDMKQGVNGFRARRSPNNARIEPCPCGWRPDLGSHYRVRGMGRDHCISAEELQW